MHKNENKALGNYCIYRININFKLFKIGKADVDKKTSAGVPVRIAQQIRILRKLYRFELNVDWEFVFTLYSVTTKDGKEQETEHLNLIYKNTGEIPDENKKSFNPEI